eukprot:787371-Rhodomonas_salina.1
MHTTGGGALSQQAQLQLQGGHGEPVNAPEADVHLTPREDTMRVDVVLLAHPRETAEEKVLGQGVALHVVMNCLNHC